MADPALDDMNTTDEDENAVLETDAADEPELVDEDEAEAPPASEQMVPLSRLNEVIAQRDQMQGMLNHLSQVVEQRPPQPQGPPRPAWERQNDTPDQKAAAGFLAERVAPVLDAELATVRQTQQQMALATALFIQEQRAMQIPGYTKYAEAARQYVQQFLPSLRGLPDGVNLYQAAYTILESQDRARGGSTTARRQAVRRAAPAAAGEAQPPARPSQKRGGQPLTADRVKGMTLKELEQEALARNARV